MPPKHPAHAAFPPQLIKKFLLTELQIGTRVTNMNAIVGLSLPDAEIENEMWKDVRGANDGLTMMTPWGYVIGTGNTDGSLMLRQSLARFFGIVLFMSGLTLGLLPDGAAGSGLIAMKLGGMVIFMLVGAVLFRAGRERPGIEMHVDLKHKVIRLGNRSLTGDFQLSDLLRFDEGQSVFMLRGTDKTSPSRLYLRLGENIAIEIAKGKRNALERVRQRLTYDLTYGSTRQR